jgi:MoaA/NifB/PqqE/SkfB family radical SAM enzyme
MEPSTIFPESISLTITNACNLRCKMCGQWSEEGYIAQNGPSKNLKLNKWKSIIDELAENGAGSVLLRGGEPFLFPGFLELIRYINSKNIFTSIDTNGTQIHLFADELVRLGNIHLTISIDGPEKVHDRIRGLKGCFAAIKQNIHLLRECERKHEKKISTSLTFTISSDNYDHLGQIPDIARELTIPTITIVPYYWIPESDGLNYEKELQEIFQCRAFSWRGFHHDAAGVDVEKLILELRKYRSELKEIINFPYLTFDEADYRQWFTDYSTPVGTRHCPNVERLLDIQPNGDANFCVDFPDYSIGNIKDCTIKELWNSPRATSFRGYRKSSPLTICYRCGSKYMGTIPDKV